MHLSEAWAVSAALTLLFSSFSKEGFATFMKLHCNNFDIFLTESFYRFMYWYKKKLRVNAWTYLQLPLRQWGAGNVYLLVLSSWKVNIAENPIAVLMGL